MIHHHPLTRGRAMQFIRREDLTPHTRIDIVQARLAQSRYLRQDDTNCAAYRISRTFLYQLSRAADLQLETLF